MPPAIGRTDQTAPKDLELEAGIHEYGEKIFTLMDAAEPPSVFSKKGFYGALMDWAMRDEHFKTQLFRFVDVLPTLTSSSEVSRHLKEYLGDEAGPGHPRAPSDGDSFAVKGILSPAFRMGLKAAG